MDKTELPSVFTTAQLVVTKGRLEVLKNKLMKERQLPNLNEVERIRVLNLLTYVYHCYDNGCQEKDGVTGTSEGISFVEVIHTTQTIYNADSTSHTDSLSNTARLDNAFSFNDEAVKLSKWTNVTTILYRTHLLEEKGDQVGAEQCRLKLKDMLSSCYEKKLVEAQAELAYTFARLGGLDNNRRAILLYQEALEKYTNDDWKFGLGQANSHVVCWYRNSPGITICEINKHMNAAVKILMDVAENSCDTELRSTSYSKLAILKRVLINAKLETENCRILYKDHNVKSLVYKALELDPINMKTLRDCGRILKEFDVDRAIEVLEKSVQMMDHSLTYHNLGLCYEIKAKQKVGLENSEIKMETKSKNDGASENCEPVSPNQENIENKEERAINQISDSIKQISIVSASNSSDVLVTEPRVPIRDRNDLVLTPGVTSAEKLQISKQTPESPNKDALSSLEQAEDDQQAGFEIVHSKTKRCKKKNKKKKNNSGNIKCPIIVYHLDRQDHYVDKAIEYHQKSIQLSSNSNYPAMYTLGLILRSCGCLQEAKENFQSIVDSYGLQKQEYAVKPATAICAHLQLGLCLLDGVEQSEEDYEEYGAQMSKAIDAVGTLRPDPNVAHKLRLGLSKLMARVRQRSDADAQKLRNALRKFVTSVKEKLSSF